MESLPSVCSPPYCHPKHTRHVAPIMKMKRPSPSLLTGSYASFGGYPILLPAVGNAMFTLVTMVRLHCVRASLSRIVDLCLQITAKVSDRPRSMTRNPYRSWRRSSPPLQTYWKRFASHSPRTSSDFYEKRYYFLWRSRSRRGQSRM